VTRCCEEKKFPIDFLVNMDADIIFCEDCMERIFVKFIEDERLGVASPHVADIPFNVPVEPWKLHKYAISQTNYASYDFREPSNGLRVYRRRTFEDIGGIPVTMMADTVAVVKAKLKGWKAKRFKDIVAFKTRETGSSVSYGYILSGLRYYYLDYHPLMVMSNVALEIGKGRIGRAIMFLTGYIKGVITEKGKIKDEDIRSYFRITRLKELICSFWKGVFGR